ncbi:MAG: BlaI/MecI/CopY family transcriptional regulator [Planctomycetes bacterium]|nr:BlaI/MecI/CopY family transcriptional regulator [Planctomycetota bacterium]
MSFGQVPPSANPDPAQPSDAEWKVLNALWRRHPASARELLGLLSAERWAYTTLKTMLDRMQEKGFVRAERRGNVSWYEPLLERKRAQRAAVRDLIARVFEGAAGSLLTHLVDDERLSAAQRKRLSAEIARAEREEARRARG